MIRLLPLLFFNVLAVSQAWGAACCGGGVAAPSLILGDDKAIFTNSYSYGTITDDVSTNGIWRERDENSIVQSYRLEGAHIFADRFQVGGSLPLVSRSRSGRDQNGQESSQGLGDTSLTLGYEFLPEWSYSSWRPKGVGFVQLTLPTGRSVFESEDDLQLDARGRGFWALGLGAVFTKIFGRWDTMASVEVHHSFAKNANSPQAGGRLRLEPSQGGTAQVGVGYNWSAFRLGFGVQHYYEGEIQISGALTDTKDIEQYTTALLTGSYIWSDDWSGSVAFADQTLLGAPRNTSLGQTLSLQVQRRWSR